MTSPDPDAVEQAAQLLRAGGLVAMPTETVYGLAADASNEAAVRRIFQVKRRPPDHPLIVHVAEAAQLQQWAAEVPRPAALLAEACWPGPLTLIVPRAEHVLDVVTGGRTSIGVRVPAHPVAARLLRAFGGGLAAPSANRFGMVSPTTADHVRADLGGEIDMILDGGSSPVGVESTIVDCTTEPPQVLRPGAITLEQIESVLGGPLGAASGPRRASGMFTSHYAPHATVLLAETAAEATTIRDRNPGAVIIGDGVAPADYARNLYAWLRDADRSAAPTVVAVLPVADGLGRAIRDRLFKAAAARDG